MCFYFKNMNCFYCNSIMEEKYDLYVCNNKIIDDLYHSYSVEQSNLKDKEISYYLINSVNNEYLAFFVSEACMNEDPKMRTWENYFLLDDFDILKDIKNLEQLHSFVNKIKTFS